MLRIEFPHLEKGLHLISVLSTFNHMPVTCQNDRLNVKTACHSKLTQKTAHFLATCLCLIMMLYATGSELSSTSDFEDCGLVC